MLSSLTPSWCLESSARWSCRPGRHQRAGATGDGRTGRWVLLSDLFFLSEQVQRGNDFLDAGMDTPGLHGRNGEEGVGVPHT